jgi:cytidyltransferase-like protein
LVPARFQGFHKGHKVVLEEAKRISPNVTVGLRVDDGDIIDLNRNMELLRTKGYKVVPTPDIDEDWTNWANDYDIYVQGNPTVIKKFKNSKCKLHYIPRYGNVSGTDIRNMVKENKDPLHNIDRDVLNLIKKSI